MCPLYIPKKNKDKRAALKFFAENNSADNFQIFNYMIYVWQKAVADCGIPIPQEKPLILINKTKDDFTNHCAARIAMPQSTGTVIITASKS